MKDLFVKELFSMINIMSKMEDVKEYIELLNKSDVLRQTHGAKIIALSTLNSNKSGKAYACENPKFIIHSGTNATDNDERAILRLLNRLNWTAIDAIVNNHSFLKTLGYSRDEADKVLDDINILDYIFELGDVIEDLRFDVVSKNTYRVKDLNFTYTGLLKFADSKYQKFIDKTIDDIFSKVGKRNDFEIENEEPDVYLD